MSIPSKYPVTMITGDGREYEVTTPSGYVTAVYSQGHRVKPAPAPAAAKPVAPAPKPADTPTVTVYPAGSGGGAGGKADTTGGK